MFWNYRGKRCDVVKIAKKNLSPVNRREIERLKSIRSGEVGQVAGGSSFATIHFAVTLGM